jgi:hypothetical protein
VEIAILGAEAIPQGVGSESRKTRQDIKANLLARIQELDWEVDGPGLDEDGWALR